MSRNPQRNIIPALMQHPLKWQMPRTISRSGHWNPVSPVLPVFASACFYLHSPALACNAAASARYNVLLYILISSDILDMHVFAANCICQKSDCLYLLTQVWKVSKFHFLIIRNWNLSNGTLIFGRFLCNVTNFDVQATVIAPMNRNSIFLHIRPLHFSP